jgi:hypothetical protein
MLASRATLGAGPIGVVASRSFYALQLRKRLDGLAHDVDPALNGEPFGRRYGQLLWAVPEGARDFRRLGWLAAQLKPDGRLWILVPGPLARLLPEHRPGDGAIWLPRALLWLHRTDLRLEAVFGFHGFSSVLWTWGARLSARLGCPALADRCLVAMRQAYVTDGFYAVLAPLALVVARPRAGHNQ